MNTHSATAGLGRYSMTVTVQPPSTASDVDGLQLWKVVAVRLFNDDMSQIDQQYVQELRL